MDDRYNIILHIMCIFFLILLFCRRMEYIYIFYISLCKENCFFQNKLIDKFRMLRMRINDIGRSFNFCVYAKGGFLEECRPSEQEGYFMVVTLISLLTTCSMMANISFPNICAGKQNCPLHLMSIPSTHHFTFKSKMHFTMALPK